jgi:tRNA (guanine-N7-)-methyltransferase
VNLELLNEELFPPGCFDRILVNHPDPWPKKRHKHHRFFRPDTLNWLVTILASGGCIEVASDHAGYFFDILRLFEEHPRFESALPPPFYSREPEPDRPMSRFEKKKRSAGETVRFLRFTKRD